ncbi:FAD-binding oxidoreductase [Acetobacter oeni]|uniref:D-2-hydroxyacid dehydrogenase n=1 Tax=Acetobacter oeni TaxID=304077 RepID=A0A511XFX5_9PROT|nr:FAD-binding oxidoreductase [Acetobacter oeni]MBB3882242.1 FAD/FMN-containing dehydrogenase [Acetobacter oeni]NHO17998.1 FAD-binding protein [Acetobacter oeni]GBR01232.1 oxidoreductase [Acetobacter oeni LMG 21952]GEN61839.1 D-2-hydroxyacid dehydrogenase [Acetobacter oeni]
MTGSSSAAFSDTLINALKSILGPGGLLTQDTDTAPYLTDWRGMFHGKAFAVARPASTEACAKTVKLCAWHKIPVVPQGGNTSMVGGATPDDSGRALVIVMSRMNRVRDIDRIDNTMSIDAGVTLKAAQDAALDAGLMLPLSISSEGSADIGGILATNAGGNNTVRYGNARELALGLEAVLPDGRILNLMRRLRKDNTGYALRQLFIGSEGTLAIITGAILQLQPKPKSIETALCAVADARAALELFAAFRNAEPSAIQAFEFMSGLSMQLVNTLIPDAPLPLAEPSPAYVLVELASPRGGDTLRGLMEEVLGKALEDGLVSDAVLAESEAQRQAFWKLREEHSEAQKRAGTSVKNDVSVPLSAIPEFIDRATTACKKLIAGIRVAPFGHIGDGNIHFNLVQPEGADGAAFLACDHEIMDAVTAIVRDLGGSFSAEHGVGQLKTYMMPAWRGGAELDVMRHIKTAIDPEGIMNPGKMLPEVG